MMYGGSCGIQPGFPAPAISYGPGTVLVACIKVPPLTGQEFRADFVHSVSSGRRLLRPARPQLDSFAAPYGS
jgi:hypothetical protein